MFSDETERRDWIFGIVVTLVIVGGLFWIRSQPIEEKRGAQESASAAVAPPAQEILEREPSDLDNFHTNEVTRRHSPRTIARVFECERDGQRILSDQPCGEDTSVREIAAPNRMRPQDTSSLYDPPPRSIQMQKFRASRQPRRSQDNAALCARIDRERDQINARMRHRYTNWEGEYYREQMRKLSARRWEAGCGK